MRGNLLTVVLLLFAVGTPLMAQNGRRWSARDHGRQGWQGANHGHHWNHDRDYDRYRDRDIRQDERAIDNDRWEIRDDLRRGDYRAARREREEMRERERDVYRDRHRSSDRARAYGYDHDSAWGRNQGWDWTRFNSFVRR